MGVGYVIAKKRTVSMGAPRVSFTIANGRSPGPGMQVCHSCDNPTCVNPAHLWEGTPQDNTDDRVAKGRSCGGSIARRV